MRGLYAPPRKNWAPARATRSAILNAWSRAFDAARSGDDGEVGASDGGGRIGKLDDGVVGLRVAADQFVGLGDANDFLHSGHFFERAGVDFALVAGDADGGALRAGDGVGAVSKRFDFLANGADLLFGGLRLHDDEHSKYSELISLAPSP